MKAFVEKTKYEQRQALLDLIQDYSTMSMPNRPVFLNKIHVTQRFLDGELQLGRAASTYEQYPMKEPAQEAPQEVQAVETERSVGLTSSRVKDPRRSVRGSFLQTQRPEVKIKLETKEEEEDEPKTKIMRRRSCCCKWCGGINGKEQKHQDIITNLQKYGRKPPAKPEPIRLDDSPMTRSSPKRKTFTTMKSLRRGSTKGFPDSPTNPKKGISCVDIDSKPKSKNLLSLKTKSKFDLEEEEAKPSNQDLEKREPRKSKVLSKKNSILGVPQEPEFIYTLQSIDEGNHEEKMTPQKNTTKGTMFFRGSTISNGTRLQRDSNLDNSFTDGADKSINLGNPHNLKINLNFDSQPSVHESYRKSLIMPTSLENLAPVIDLKSTERATKLPYNQIFEAADSKDEISDSPCNFRLRSLPDEVVRQKIKFIQSLKAQDTFGDRVQTQGGDPLTFCAIQNLKKSAKQKKKSPEKNFKITTLFKDSKTRIQGIYLQKNALLEPMRASHNVTRLQSPSSRVSTALNGLVSPTRNSFAKLTFENTLTEGSVPASCRELKGGMTSPKISSSNTIKIVRKKNIRIKSEANPIRPPTTTANFNMYGKSQMADLALASPRTLNTVKKLAEKKEARKAS